MQTYRTANTTTEKWLTIEEYGGPLGINSEKHARLRCESGEFASRPHDSEVLSDAGVKQYYVTLQGGKQKTQIVSDEALMNVKANIQAEMVREVPTLILTCRLLHFCAYVWYRQEICVVRSASRFASIFLRREICVQRSASRGLG